MKLTFKRLQIKNFKGVVEANLELDKLPGLHFVRGENLVEPRLGSNGSGKTTMFDALAWCLSGKTPGGLRNTDIIPWGNGKSPTTTVILTIGVGTETYDILRTYNPIALLLDDDQCSQEEIDNLLGFNFDLFTNTILLAQGRPLFFDLPPKGKMQLFTDVLDLDKWEARSEVAKETAANFDRKVADAASKVDSLKSELSTLKGMYKEYSERSAEWKEKREFRLSKMREEFEVENDRLNSIQDKHDAASVQYDSAATELKLMRAKREEIYRTAMKVEKEYSDIMADKKHTSGEIRRLENELANLKDAKTCPTCGQKVGAKDLASYKENLVDKLAGLRTNHTEGVPTELADRLEEAQDAVSRHSVDEKKLEERAAEWRDKVDYLTPELARSRANVQRLETSIAELDKESNPYREQVFDLEQKIKLIKEDIEDGENYVDLTRRKAERSRYWVKGFKDIRLFVIEDVLNELELATKIMLEELGLVDWSIQYDIEKETKSGTIQRGIQVIIQSPSAPQSVKWECWSGGESQRLRLVGALALSEVLLSYAGITTNLEVLDEPTRHLSKEGVYDTWRYLAERAERLDRVCFYVDHQSVESARFASVLTVSKDEEGISIQEG